MPEVSKRLHEKVEAPAQARRKGLDAAVSNHLRTVLNRRVVGLPGLTFHDVLRDGSGLYVDGLMPQESGKTGLSELVAAAVGGEKFLVVGPPGGGKSTAAIATLKALTQAPNETLGALVDLRRRQYLAIGANDGTPDYTSRIIARAIGVSNESAREALDSNDQRLLLILDSLDEGLVGLNLDAVHETTNYDLFERADIAFCRAQFFQQYLSNTNFSQDRTVVHLHSWTNAQKEEYARVVLTSQLDADGEPLATALGEALAEGGAASALLSVPLRLNLAISLLLKSSLSASAVIELNVLQLFEEFVYTTLELEVDAKGAAVESTQAFAFLEDVAWNGYQGTSVGPEERELSVEGMSEESALRSLCSIAVQATVQEATVALRGLVNSGLLEVRKDSGRIHRRSRVAFSHRSLQEFFVASRIQSSLIEGGQDLRGLFSIVMTPEVWEFIKESFVQINMRSSSRARVFTNMAEAIRSIDETDMAGSDRLALEQLYYYMGMLRTVASTEFLLDKYRASTDPWLSRGIVIGLAFSGNYVLLNEYVDLLQRERLSEGDHNENAANIGCHLSFFGDQEFDAASPDVDRGGDSCDKTITRLIYQLSTHTNRANWRIDLYTLLDLSEHRLVSLTRTRETLRRLVEQLKLAEATLLRDPVARDWPDMDRLRALILSVEV